MFGFQAVSKRLAGIAVILAVEGRSYTQHECHAEKEIHTCLGRGVPENIVKVREGVLLCIIEAKAISC